MSVKSDAHIGVYLSERSVTIRDVRDWLAEVERLRIPESTTLDECVLTVFWRSEIIDTTENLSELGVPGVDLLVGMPR